MKINLASLALITTSHIAIGQTHTAQIEQITVTASGNERALSQLSSNLSIINEDEIAVIAPQHINQTLVRVPGAWISRGNGQEHLTAIRSPVLTGAGGCGAFFMAQDAISLRAPSFCNTNQLFDANTEQAERIEVLRGPASTLYGSNAVHGVINIITPNAFEQNKAALGMSVGPNDYVSSNFTLGSVNKTQAFMIYGNGAHDGGYKDDSGFEQQKINAIHQYQDNNWSIKSVVSATNLNQQTAGFIKGDEAYKDPVLKTQNPNPEAFRDSQTFRAYSDLRFQSNDHTQYRLTPYVRWTDMTFLQHYLPWQPLEENSQQGAGIKASIEKQIDHVTWMVGLDVDMTEGRLTETQANDFSAAIPAGQHYDYTVDAIVYSPYSKVHWTINDNFSLTAGIRYDATRLDYNNHLSAGSACESSVDNCRFTRPDDTKVKYNEWSYQLGANYAFADSQLFYAQFSNGYRAPQATELFRLQAGQSLADLAPEQLNAVELGYRGQWSNVFYDLTAFSMQKDHFIFQDTNKHNISNGKTSHHGLEFLLNFQLANNFYVKLNGTIANHTYDAELTLSRANINGNEIDTAPQHMGSAQLGWENDQGKLVELEWIHLGNYYLNPENSAEYAGHNLLNFRVKLELDNHWSVGARLLNIMDEDYAERADYSFGSYRYFVGEPRSLFLSARYTF